MELASGDPAIALALVNRVIDVNGLRGSLEHELNLNLACRLLMDVRTKEILPPDAIDILSSNLRTGKSECEPTKPAALP